MDGLLSLSDTPDRNNREEFEQWLEDRSLDLATIIEVQIRRIVTQAFEAFIKTVDETTVTASGDLYAIDDIPAQWNVVLNNSVIPHTTQTHMAGSISAYSVASSKADIPGEFVAQWLPVVNQEAVQYAAQAESRLRGVGQTLWNDIRQKVSKTIETGNKTETLKRELESLGRFSEYRADTIARTETSSAYINGDYAGHQALGKYGPVEKVWVATLDARTRPNHLAVWQSSLRSPVPFSQPFQVGGVSMMYPHAPGAPAKEVVNCRCYYDALYPGDKRPNGSVIPRKSQPTIPTPQAAQQTGAREFLRDGTFSPDFTSGQWIEVSDDNLDRFIEAWTAGKGDLNKVVIGDHTRKLVKASKKFVVNGDTIVHDVVGVSDDAFRVLVDEIDTLKSYKKQAGERLIVRVAEMKDNVNGDCELVRHAGQSQMLRINAKSLESDRMLEMTGWKQASFPMEARRWTIPHEYGHAIDEGYFVDAPRNMLFGKWKRQPAGVGLSRYGRTDKWEGFAESFADWFTTKGTTENPATLAYAKHYGWRKP